MTDTSATRRGVLLGSAALALLLVGCARTPPTPTVHTNAGPIAEKLLRVGHVRAGQLVSERLIPAGASVTVGSGAEATFSVNGLAEIFVLFSVENGGHALHFRSDMQGKIAIDGEILTLEQLRAGGQTSERGDTATFALQPSARGKVNIGDSTILFQFVPPPPEPK
ncbi:MAG: hypothetical protein ACI8RZ_007546 [Myxococcota bacterium]|jgi:hypothetical protein